MKIKKTSPSVSGGIYTRTRLVNGSVQLAPALLASSYPGDWGVTGAAATLAGDAATIKNTDSSDRYFWKTLDLSQSTATPVTLRIKASGKDIEAPTNNGFSIYLVATYTASGLAGGVGVEAQVPFPAGTWAEQQFSVRVVPTQPITYLYAYVFARNKKGELTVRDIEVFPDTGTAAKIGEWVSDPVDLSDKAFVAGASGTDMKHLLFFYGDIANVDGFGSVEHSKEALSAFDVVVCKEPGELNTRQDAVVQYLISQGKQVYGYAHIGGDSGIPALTDAQISAISDRCAAKGYYGLFLDMAGYDWNVTRTKLNTNVNYAHGKGLKVMANAWYPSDVLSSATHTLNPGGVATALGSGDWVLLESFFSQDSGYAGTSNGFADTMAKYTNTRDLAAPLGVLVATLAYSRDAVTLDDTSDRDASYLLSAMLGAKAWSYGGTSDSDIIEWRDTPSLNASGWKAPMIQVSPTRWEREGDTGVVWFTATDTPATRAAGIVSYEPVQYTPSLDASKFSSQRVKVTWETANAISGPWSRIANQTANRFARARVTLENA